ncbi:MAG: trigger factor [Kiritimatiellae bacterium]|nr:trigger factor [Kiritimatiellia bacterium]
MKTFLETVGPCRVRVRVAFDPPDVAEVRRAIVEQMSKTVTVPGFRPGRVPPEVTELRYRNEVTRRTHEALLNRATLSAFDAVPERALMVVDRGAEALTDAAGPHECWVLVETMPDFELPEYRGIPVRVPPATVSEEEVDRAVRALREERMGYRKVADRPVAVGDWVKVDAVGEMDGRPLAEMDGAAKRLARIAGQWLSTEPEAFPPGLGASLVGSAVGESRTVTVKFPDRFGVAELAGRSVVYRATVLAIREPVLPELDDAFCSALGVHSVDELRAKVRSELEEARRRRIREDVRGQILQYLLARTPMTLPPAAVEEETRDLVVEMVRQAMGRGADEEAIRRNREQIEAAARASAEQRLRVRFILDRIAEAEHIVVSDEDLERHATAIAGRSGSDAATWLREVRERGRIEQLRAMLRPEKVLEHLAGLARVEEGAQT